LPAILRKILVKADEWPLDWGNFTSAHGSVRCLIILFMSACWTERERMGTMIIGLHPSTTRPRVRQVATQPSHLTATTEHCPVAAGKNRGIARR